MEGITMNNKRKNKDIKHLTFRIDENLLQKFNYVAQQNDRSMNGLLLNLVKNYLQDFEEQTGKSVKDLIKKDGKD